MPIPTFSCHKQYGCAHSHCRLGTQKNSEQSLFLSPIDNTNVWGKQQTMMCVNFVSFMHIYSGNRDASFFSLAELYFDLIKIISTSVPYRSSTESERKHNLDLVQLTFVTSVRILSRTFLLKPEAFVLQNQWYWQGCRTQGSTALRSHLGYLNVFLTELTNRLDRIATKLSLRKHDLPFFLFHIIRGSDTPCLRPLPDLFPIADPPCAQSTHFSLQTNKGCVQNRFSSHLPKKQTYY